jgi:tetratricopeptide (TPR) repeat protein
MKRILIICLAVLGYATLNAQEQFIPINFAALTKKVEKSNAEITDPKKQADPKTWLRRAELMQKVYEVDIEQTYQGMTPTNLQLFYADPVKGTEEFDGKTFETYSYPRIKFYFENNAMQMWSKNTWAYDKPLTEMFNCLIKTTELDTEGALNDKITEDYIKLKNHLKKDGLNCYYLNDKEGALSDFEMVLKVDKQPVLKGVIDTILIQYSGIIAREMGQLERAIGHYKELAAVDHQPNTYLLIKEDYLKLKDTTSAVSAMEEAFIKYPDTMNVVANLVDLYIKVNKIQDGLKTIDAALQKNPEKGELYYWKGRLLLNTTDEKHIDKALEVYEIAIQKDPELYYAYYDIGFIYFLQGQDLFEQAGAEKDKNLREAMIKIGTEDYNKALPKLEKALDLNQTNKDIRKETLDTLKRIYYKLQMTEKYDQVVEMLKNL